MPHYQSLYPGSRGHVIYHLQQQSQVLALSSKPCFLSPFSLTLSSWPGFREKENPFSFLHSPLSYLSKGENLYDCNIWYILILNKKLFIIWNSNVLFWATILREDSQLYFILRKHTRTFLIPYPWPTTSHLPRRCLSCIPVPWLLPRKTVWQ